MIGLIHAAAYALLTPPWQAPDEPGHVEYACLMAANGRVPEARDRSAALQAEIITSLARHDFWQHVRQPEPEPLPHSFAADPFLARSGHQIGDEPPLYYIAPALLCRLGQDTPIATRLILMRLVGAVLFGLTGATVVWAWQSTFGVQQAILLLLLPMPAFIAGSANNDALALCTATAVFAAVVRGQRLRWNRRRLAGLAALLVLALLSKKTNAFLVPWLGLLGLAAGWRRFKQSQAWRDSARWATATLAVVGGLLVGLLLLPSQAPAGWRGNKQPFGQGQVAAAGAHAATQEWVAQVIDRSTRDTGRLFQTIVAPRALALRGQNLVASIAVRSQGEQPQPGRLTVRDAGGYTQVPFTATDVWQRVTLTHTVALTTTYVKMTLAPYGSSDADTGSLLADDAVLEAPRLAQQPGNLLRNPGFEAPARWAELLVAAPLEKRWEQFAPRLYTDDALAAHALRQYFLYTALLFPGFWGNFGWLQHPLPIWLYSVLAFICVLAILGLAKRSRPSATLAGRDFAPAAFISAWLLAVALILLQTLTPMIGRAWQPQGRYLFPALFPITGMLLVGLAAWLDFDQRPRRLSAVCALLLALDLFSLLQAAQVF